jgi:hypothetical protein
VPLLVLPAQRGAEGIEVTLLVLVDACLEDEVAVRIHDQAAHVQEHIPEAGHNEGFVESAQGEGVDRATGVERDDDDLSLGLGSGGEAVRGRGDRERATERRDDSLDDVGQPARLVTYPNSGASS